MVNTALHYGPEVESLGLRIKYTLERPYLYEKECGSASGLQGATLEFL